MGKSSFKYAWVLDNLKAERERGKKIYYLSSVIILTLIVNTTQVSPSILPSGSSSPLSTLLLSLMPLVTEISSRI